MCTRDLSYQNSNGIQPITNVSIYNKTVKGLTCKLYNKYPNFTPYISSLSVNSSASGAYSLVYINGANFIPPCVNTTYVNFGSFKQLPITFYSPYNISFVIPLNAPVGVYNVNIVNIYNGNFSPQINQSYSGNQNYSNTFTYTIT